MPPFRSPPTAASAKARTEELLTPEEIGERRRRRLLWIVLPTAAALVVAGFLSARPVGRAIKGWQARRAATQAMQLIDQGKWKEAQTKVQDACQLRPTEPEVVRAAAIFLTRTGNNREALGFWKQLEAVHALTPDEQRDYGLTLLRMGETEQAEQRLRLAWPDGQPGTPADWHARLQLAARRHDAPAAIDLAKKLLADPATTDRHRLDAALSLLSLNPSNAQPALDAVRQIARGKDPESLEASVLLARQAGQLSAMAREGRSVPKPVMTIEEAAAAIDAHPLAKIQHRLLVYDLRLAQDPSQREALMQAAIDKFSSGDADTLAGLGAWLYAKGEYAKTLAVIPLTKAVENRALYLQHLDALGALGRWSEIETLIKTQRFTLDPMMEQMYLARCSEQLGQPESRDVHWNAAVQAAGASVEKLLSLSAYAQRNGAIKPAESAVRAALKASPNSRPAHESLVAILQQQGATAALREEVGALLKVWPEDESARNDAAYLDALLNQNVSAARDAARALAKQAPSSLPHKVALALAELRLDHALTAMEVLGGNGFPAASATPSQLAVYAAVLWEVGGYNAEAKETVKRIGNAFLLPEERGLIQPILAAQ